MQTIEINSKNYRKEIEQIKKYFPNAMDKATLVIQEKKHKESKKFKESDNVFLELSKKYKNFKIPKNIDISRLADDMLS